jgi:hypothetical protein
MLEDGRREGTSGRSRILVLIIRSSRSVRMAQIQIWSYVRFNPVVSRS